MNTERDVRMALNQVMSEKSAPLPNGAEVILSPDEWTGDNALIRQPGQRPSPNSENAALHLFR